MKQWKWVGLSLLLCVGVLAGCGNGATENGGKADAFDWSKSIHATTRENGSGTRGAFIELLGIEVEENGKKVDKTSTSIVETNNTSVMMTTVAQDRYAVGYISLGSVNDTIKTVAIDGVKPSPETIKSGEYKISRPLNIVYKEGLSEIGQDFVAYIMSKNGQQIIQDAGYVGSDDGAAYEKKSGLKGKLVVSGSSSITPIMEKLKEAYIKVNPDVSIEIQQSDSSTGITNTIDGTCDIGMASRALKGAETKEALTVQSIAQDGIAVIVNNDNPIKNMTAKEVKSIYLGEINEWQGIKHDEA